MSVSHRQKMVDFNHEKLSVVKQCRLLRVARSSLYYQKNGESAFNLELMRKIDETFMNYPFFGVQQMRRYLVKNGYSVGDKRVRRLMRLMGLSAVYQKPRTSVASKGDKRYPYLLGHLTIDKSNQVWCADITYIPLKRGFYYMVAVMDWYSRKILSWQVSNNLETDFCISTLQDAFARYGKPEIFNTDQGSQFTSSKFTNQLHENGIHISMDGRGRCMDNIFIERLWRSLKYENIYLCEYENGLELKKGIREWINFYNNIRPHSSLLDMTPDEYYKKGMRKIGQSPTSSLWPILDWPISAPAKMEVTQSI